MIKSEWPSPRLRLSRKYNRITNNYSNQENIVVNYWRCQDTLNNTFYKVDT